MAQTSPVAYNAWKAKQDEQARLAQEEASRKAIERNAAMQEYYGQNFGSQAGLNLDGLGVYEGDTGTFMGNNFGYSKDSGYTLGGVQMGGPAYDPRIAAQFGEDDFSAADAKMTEYETRINNAINAAMESGIAPTYKTGAFTGRISLGNLRQGGESSDFRESFDSLGGYEQPVMQYLQQTDPELFKIYQGLTNENSNFAQQLYMQSVYDSANDRVGSQYTDNYFDSAAEQWKQLTGEFDQVRAEEQKAYLEERNKPAVTQPPVQQDRPGAIYSDPLQTTEDGMTRGKHYVSGQGWVLDTPTTPQNAPQEATAPSQQAPAMQTGTLSGKGTQSSDTGIDGANYNPGEMPDVSSIYKMVSSATGSTVPAASKSNFKLTSGTNSMPNITQPQMSSGQSGAKSSGSASSAQKSSVPTGQYRGK